MKESTQKEHTKESKKLGKYEMKEENYVYVLL